MFEIKTYKGLQVAIIVGMLVSNANTVKGDWDYDIFWANYSFQIEELRDLLKEVEAIMDKVDSVDLRHLASLIATGGIQQPESAVRPVFRELEHARSIISLACLGVPPYVIANLDLKTMGNTLKGLGDGFLTELLDDSITKVTTDLSLFELNFADDPIKPSVFKLVVKFLEKNGALKKLSLNGSEIDISDIQALTKALGNNTSLLELKIIHTHLGDEGIRLFADALKINQTLKTLYLWDCQIGDAGVKDLSEALKSNRSLVTLDLWRNCIGTEGARALAEGLKFNTSLCMLKIEENYVNDYFTYREFLNAKKSKRHLTVIPCLQEMPFTDIFSRFVAKTKK